MAKGQRYPKWTPERLAKFQATMAAKRKEREKGHTHGNAAMHASKQTRSQSVSAPHTKVSADTMVYLGQYEQSIIQGIKSGRIKSFNKDQLLALSALVFTRE